MTPIKALIAGAVFTVGALALGQPASAQPNNEPATLGFAVGYYDVQKNSPRNEAIDFRLEYRSAFDMLSLANARNSVIAIRPFGGIEATSDAAFYGLGGFVFDVPFGKYFVLSPNLAVGLYEPGNGKRLGSFVEFRSTVEAGVRFDDASRLTVSFGHISNAGLTGHNPGTEILSVYYHVPVDKIFGR